MIPSVPQPGKTSLSLGHESSTAAGKRGDSRVPPSTACPDNSTRHEESTRRQTAIQLALQAVLSDAHMGQALQLCEDEFPADQPFSVATFCQRLVEILPGVDLTAEARLQLLRTMRQTAAQLGVGPLTAATGIPSRLLQAKSQSEGRPDRAALDHRSSRPENPTGLEASSQVSRCPQDDSLSTTSAPPVKTPDLPLPAGDNRRTVRKPTQFKGVYQRKETDAELLPMVVDNLSVGGLRVRPAVPATLSVGDTLIVQFGLEQPRRSMVRASVCVRWVQDDAFGAEFLNPDKLREVITDLVNCDDAPDQPAAGKASLG